MKIIADEHIPFLHDYFDQCGELVLKPGRQLTHADVADADVLLVRSVTHVDKKLLKDTKVKFVGTVTAGADHLDTAWLTQENIIWQTAQGFNAPPVADYVVSVVAALQRKKLLAPARAKAAVIGVGHVGRLVVERLKALNYEVILCDPLRAENEKDFISTALEDISNVDLICLHVPLTKTGKHATQHFIDKDFLQRQKPGCVLLNAGRGAVINTADLLAYGSHLVWCFDVWEDEPHINKTVLEQALIATPHIAGYSVQSKMRGIEMIYQAGVAQKIFPALAKQAIKMPQQQLAFAGEKHHWQDIVLGIFNPLVMTAMMKTLLFSVEDTAEFFDQMRNQFNYRHELAYTNIADIHFGVEDADMLRGVGVGVF